ncbi:endonuclease/exonuclease/phosphatase family protein [Saccharopolyspora erythraea]|uniref:endonuclease/exonuclease/phosphatase family protein n=1 Tax=Saccharopolyspora erythraea TaxID=1836 RepID=UPI0032C20F49
MVGGEVEGTLDDVEADEDREPGRRKSPAVTVLLVLAALVFAGWAALPLTGYDSNRYAAALVALTQYAVPAGLVLVVLALVLRRWLTTLVVGLVTAALVASVAPRAIPDPPTPVQGTPLKVMSANLYFGEADAARVVELVRSNRIDVLSLQELTPELAAALDRAGLGELMPHRVFEAHAGAEGTGIASRYPLRSLALVPPTTMRQPSALVDLPGDRDVELVAVHPVIPVGSDTVGDWQREITVLPHTPAESRPPRVLAGDFNATLDHSPLRGLLGRGYADAAEVTGAGLRPTWPRADAWLPPPVTIDHVLVSEGVVVQDYRTFEVAGADHRAVVAHLVVGR